MSKTFKSVSNPASSFSITPSADGVRTVHMHGIEATGVTVSTADAPALMLAIGECLPPIPETVRDGSYEAFMAVALEYLVKAVRALEAEAQAELEAEALELFNARQEAINSVDWEPYKEFASEDSKQTWLAVARRAREINKEEK